MKMLRPLLNVVLGLSLLVQGFGVAAQVPAAAEDVTQVAAAQMPCHDGAHDQAANPASCCNADCPDMAGCVIGHLAGMPAHLPQFSPAAQVVVVLTPQSAESVVLPFLLRPPISSHA
jgi:hypothetical protein